MFGQVLLCYHDRLGRDHGRFADALKRVNVSPLGACAMAGTSLPIEPKTTAKDLHMAGAFTNSIDAVSDRDYAVEFVSACALLMAHLSQMAEDLVLWSTPEFGFVELPDELCTSSSIMPQKKNPDMIELVRGKASSVTGHLVNLLGTLKALPIGYNRYFDYLQNNGKSPFTTQHFLKRISKQNYWVESDWERCRNVPYGRFVAHAIMIGIIQG